MKAIAACFGAALLSPLLAQQIRDYPVKPVPFTAVHVTDGFWAPRIEINRTVTIPFAFQKDEETGRVENFIRAAETLSDNPPADRNPPGYPFDDTDVYKVIEGASYALSVHPDPKLDAYVDGLIAKRCNMPPNVRQSAGRVAGEDHRRGPGAGWVSIYRAHH